MRRKCFYLIVVAVLAGLAYAAPTVQAEHLDQEIRQLAGELLEGCTLIVRVYPDAAHDPRRFEKVRVPTTGLTLQHSAVKAAYPSISDAACIAFLGADQTDERVAAIVGQRAYANPYRANTVVNLGLISEDAEYHPFWTFFDAQGEPIPHASMEIGYVVNHPAGMLWFGADALDEQGRLARLGPLGAFAFRISHPDYGLALVHNRGLDREPSGIYVVPLVPLDSPATRSSIQGTVQDTEGRPVPEAEIWCARIQDPNGISLDLGNKYVYYALTDEQGWFASCIPLVTKDLVLKGLPAPQSRYEIQIKPPRQLSLRQYGQRGKGKVVAGTRNTFTLTPMEAGKVFHTFSFEYHEGPVTDADELNKLKVFLYRDGPWAQLTYEQIKEGYALPTGTLRASTWRWGRNFAFVPIELTPDSPEHLVFRTGEAIFYQGQVINAVTDLPIADAIVSVGALRSNRDPCSVTAEQWQLLQTCVTESAMDDSPEALYRLRNRAVATDADGRFEMPFLPGFQPNINSFRIDKPGYLRKSVAAYTPPNGSGLIKIDTIRLIRAESLDDYPTFIFQDETGATIDPNDFKDSYLSVRGLDGHGFGGSLARTLEKRPFTPGTYSLEATYNRKHYVFEPVDLTIARPGIAVFTPQRVEPAEVVYQGQIIGGITARPIPRAIVVHGLLGTKRDASGLEPGQWKAIEALGPNPDPNDAALAPLLDRLNLMEIGTHQCALTDDNGWYHLAVQPRLTGLREVLLAMAQDHLGVSQQLSPPKTITTDTAFLRPDENGIITLPPLKLFPAGTVTVHPVVPDFGANSRKTRLRLRWRIIEDDPPEWVKGICTSPRDNHWASTFYRYELQPNLDQTVYVPAGLDLKVILHQLFGSPPPPACLETVRVRQGQVVKLGRVEFERGVEIHVHAVNKQGAPVERLPILCIDENGMSRYLQTKAEGLASIRVLAHSTGRFCAVYVDRENEARIEECVPFQVGGDEDTGREFTLELSDEMIRRLSQLRR